MLRRCELELGVLGRLVGDEGGTQEDGEEGPAPGAALVARRGPVTGEVVGLACAALVLARWMAADEREAARSDRRLDRLQAVENP